MTEPLTAYLVVHGITTVGAIIVFLVRNEHRITKLETTLEHLVKEHNRYTAPGGHLD